MRRIQEETKTTVSIEDDGTVQIAGDSQEAAEAGRAMIEDWIAEAEIGKIYEGPVTRIMAFGAFIKILPECEGMVHISEISDQRIDKIEDKLQIGDMVKARVIERDEKGRVNLSMRHLDAPFDPSTVRERPPERRDRGDRGDRGGRGGHDRRDRGSRPHGGGRH